MADPVFTYEVAFASDPGAASPTYSNISAYVLEHTISRGRQKELNRIDAGTCTLVLDNRSRRFDPEYAAGPYYPNVLPMRKLRVRAVHGGTTYDLFTGYVESWPQTWPGGQVSFSTITAVDGFGPLSRADIGAGDTWPAEFSGARISRVLDEAGWPAADRAIDTGYSLIEETLIAVDSGKAALEHLQEVADAELGIFFIDGAGVATYHDRHHRRTAPYLTSAGSFNDTGGPLTYTNLIPESTVELVWNDIRVAINEGFAQAEDATSQTKYLRRTLTRTIPLLRATEAADQADYLLEVYKDARYRLTGMTVKPINDTLWTQMLGREIGDHVTVTRNPPPVGSAAIVQESYIEQIEHRGRPKDWSTMWSLSTPAVTAVDWWILGDSTYGVLGSTSKLVY